MRPTQFKCYMCNYVIVARETGFSTAWTISIGQTGQQPLVYGVCERCAKSIIKEIQSAGSRKT
jgi:hypothetical protein